MAIQPLTFTPTNSQGSSQPNTGIKPITFNPSNPSTRTVFGDNPVSTQKVGNVGDNLVSTGKSILNDASATVIKGLKFAFGGNSEDTRPASQTQQNPYTQHSFDNPSKEVAKPIVPQQNQSPKFDLGQAIKNAITNDPTVKIAKFETDVLKGVFGQTVGEANKQGSQGVIEIPGITPKVSPEQKQKMLNGDPNAGFTPKTKGEAIGKFVADFLSDFTAAQNGGINQAFEDLGGAAKGTIEASPKLATTAGKTLDKLDMAKTLASDNLKVMLNELKPLKITLEDLQAVTGNKGATVEQIAKFERFKDLQQAGLSPSQILKAAEDAKVNPATKVFDFLSDAIKTAKDSISKILTPEEQKLLGSGTSKLEEIIPQGEHTPQEILGKVINSPIENTSEGKQIVKMALDAQQQGKNVVVSANEVVNKLETPSSPVTEVSSKEAMSPSVKGEGVAKTSESPQITAPIGESRGVTELPTSQAQQPTDTQVGEIGKQSKVGTSIETKTIEKGLSKSFSGTAEYTPVVIKEQAKMASDLINTNLDQAKRVVLGQEQLPKGMRAGTILKAMEDYALDKGDVGLLRGIANSPLTSETSLHAQELRLLAERNPDSPVKIMQDIANKRKADLEDRTGRKINDAVKNEVQRIKKEIKVPNKYDWNSFLDSIQC